MRAWGILPVALLLAGCMGGDVLKSWEGQSADNLVYAWGPPARDAKTADGRRVLTYTNSFTIDATSYDCQAMFRVSSAGIVESATADGNLGGCNRLLMSKPSASR